MLSQFLKNLSILKKFLFINFIVFLIIGILTLFYLNSIKPLIIKDKTSNHINILNNTIENINRLKIKFNENEIRNFLFSTRFLFQSLDRVQIFDNNFKLIGDPDNISLRKHTLNEIVDGPFFKAIEDSWSCSSVKNGKLKVCANKCGIGFDAFSEQYV